MNFSFATFGVLKPMKKEFKQIGFFAIPTVLLWVALGLFLVYTDKNEAYLLLTIEQTAFRDLFFVYITKLGEYPIWILLFLIGFGVRIRRWIAAMLAMTASGLLTLLLKRFVFEDHLRPVAHFSEDILHYVEGIRLHSMHSFPSGHTTAAFSGFVLICLLVGKDRWWLCLTAFAAALLVGVSRIYLSLHFPEDVLLGSFIGMAAAWFVYRLVNSLFSTRYFPWAERSFFALFTRIE